MKTSVNVCKWFVVAIFAVFTAAISTNAQQACTASPAGLVSWWRAEGNGLDNVGGNTAFAPLVSGDVTFGPGEVGQAFQLNSPDANLVVPASSTLNVAAGGSFSVEAWINISNVDGYHPIIEWHDNGRNPGAHLWIIPSGALYSDIKDTNGNAHPFNSANGVVTPNVFEHVALTYDHASGVGSIYLNGAVVAQANLGSFVPQTSFNLWFGHRPGDVPGDITYGSYLGGRLDEVSIYNRALGSNEIGTIYNAGAAGKCDGTNSAGIAPDITHQPTNQTVAAGANVAFSVTATGSPTLHYQWYGPNEAFIAGANNSTLILSNVQSGAAGGYFVLVTNQFGFAVSSNAVLTVTGGSGGGTNSCTPPPSGLVGWWKAENNTLDSAGTNNGFVALGPVSYAPGEVGRAFYYDTSGGFVAVPPSPSLNVGLGSGFTLEAWIQPNDLQNQMPLFEWQFDTNTDANGIHFWISSINGPGCLFANIVDSNFNSHWIYSAPGLVTADYQHVAMTYDKASGVASLYRNGVLVASQNIGSFTPNTTGNLLLGERTYLSNEPQFHYIGGLDEMSVYSRALSQSEIAAIYNAGGGGKCGGENTSVAPAITRQPTNQTVDVGGTASFSLTATGSQPLHYQWYGPNTAPIIGATNSTLTLSNVQPASAGAYYAFVMNVSGFAQSSNAVLTVNASGLTGTGLVVPNYSATNQIPYSSSGSLNAPLREQMVYGASEFPSYPIRITEIRWRPDAYAGGPLSITISNLQIKLSTTLAGPDQLSTIFTQNTGTDETLVFNGAASVSTAFTTLSNGTKAFDIRLPLQTPFVYDSTKGNLLVDLRNLYGCTPATVNFVNAAGGKDATSRVFTTDPNAANAATADTAGDVLEIIYTAATNSGTGTAPLITHQPTNQTVAAGANVSFSATATGSQPLHFQWYGPNSSVIPGATSSTLTLSNVQPANAGAYYVFVTNSFGFAQSSNAVLTVTGGGTNGGPTFGLIVPNYSISNQVYNPAGTMNQPLRMQMVYGASQFPSYPITITELRWRPDVNVDGPLSVIVSNLQVKLSTTKAGPDQLSTTFSQNTGSNETVVYNGSAAISTAFTTLGNGTKAFDISLHLQTPFVYDPSKGNLLVDLRNLYGCIPARTVEFNIVNSTGEYGDAVSRVFSTDPNATSAETADTGADVLDIVYTAATNSSSCTPAPSGIVSWWKGEGNALDAVDGNNGTLVNGLGFGPGEVGQAFLFTHTNQNVLIPASSNLDVGLGDGLTVEAWIKPATITNYDPIFEWNADDGVTYFGPHFYVLPTGNGNGQLYADVQDVGDNWHQMWSAAGLVTPNTFQHVALTYDKASGVGRIYLNGAIVVESALGTFTPKTTGKLNIGARPTDPANEQFTFTGLIDEPSVYKRALGSNEIAAIFNAGVNGKCDVTNSGTGTAPVITHQPTNQTAVAGGNATFTATATGSPTLHYQWYGPSGTLIPGATSSTLTLSNVQPANAGAYYLFVTNSFGFAQSSNAVLTVIGGSPVITQQPTNQTVPVGGIARFSVVVSVPSNAVPHFQWYGPNGAAIPGSETSTLIMFDVQPSSAGAYFVIVTNQFGSATSSNAILIVTSGGSGSNSCTPAPSGLVSWWKAEGNALDSADGNNGMLVNGVGFGAGEVGQAFLFTHTNQNVLIPASSNLDVGLGDGLTVEAWIKPSTITNYDPIFEWNADDGVTYFGPHFYVLPTGNGNGQLYADVQDVGDNWHQMWSAAGLVTPNTFQHVALTYDKASGVGRIYLNGAIVVESALGTFIPKTTGNLNIGSRPTDPANEQFTFTGLIDEPSVYKRALGSNEIAAIFNAGVNGKCDATNSSTGTAPVITSHPTNLTVAAGANVTFAVTVTGTPTLHYQWFGPNSGPILGATSATLTLSNVQPSSTGSYYVVVNNQFGFAAGTNSLVVTNPVVSSCVATPTNIAAWWPAEGTGVDIVGGATAILHGGATYAPGEVGQAFLLNGTNDYLTATSSNLNIAAGGSFTVEGWIKVSDVADYHPIVEWNDGAGHGGVHLWILPYGSEPPGVLFANLVDTNGGSHSFHAPGGSVTTNVFQHVALTYDQPSGLATIYVNSNIVAQVPLGSFAPQTSLPLWIGHRPGDVPGDATYGAHLGGLLDELTMYRRALSQSEVGAIYNAGTNGKCSPSIVVHAALNPQPTVTMSTSGGSYTLSWPLSAAGYTLQSTADLTPPINWTNVPCTLQTNGGNIEVTLPQGGPQGYFRLTQP